MSISPFYSPKFDRRNDRGFAAAAAGSAQAVKIEASSNFQYFTKSVLSGGIAGGIEICITMPTEYVKTQLQLDQRSATPRFKGIWDCVRKTVREHGVTGLYRGLASLVTFSIPKAAIRFATYDTVSEYLKGADGKLTRGKALFAGLCAGAAEAVFVVCPAETIKVKMIHDMTLETPKYRGFVHAIGYIVRHEGFGGIYKGLLATVVKQASNQAIRFFVMYNLYLWYRRKDENRPIGPIQTFFMGVFAGACSVYGNTPIDVIKTRLQGLEAHKYKGVVDCAKQIWMKEGAYAFYKGTVPRLGRVCLDCGIVFVIKEQTVKILNILWKA